MGRQKLWLQLSTPATFQNEVGSKLKVPNHWLSLLELLDSLVSCLSMFSGVKMWSRGYPHQHLRDSFTCLYPGDVFHDVVEVQYLFWLMLGVKPMWKFEFYRTVVPAWLRLGLMADMWTCHHRRGSIARFAISSLLVMECYFVFEPFCY